MFYFGWCHCLPTSFLYETLSAQATMGSCLSPNGILPDTVVNKPACYRWISFKQGICNQKFKSHHLWFSNSVHGWVTWYFCDLESSGINEEDGICSGLSERLGWDWKHLYVRQCLANFKELHVFQGLWWQKLKTVEQKHQPLSIPLRDAYW